MAVMPIKSVRFGPQQLELIARQAELEGVGVSQYIRDAAFARAVMDSALHGADESANGYARRLADAIEQVKIADGTVPPD